jgi:hypothetical protein
MKKMEENYFGVICCLIVGLLVMLFASGERNTHRAHKTTKCDHDWLFDGENGSKAGAFYRCRKCGKAKYIPYKELMGMPEEDYNYWSTREPTSEELYKQSYMKQQDKSQ